jgi:hypothetical protein
MAVLPARERDFMGVPGERSNPVIFSPSRLGASGCIVVLPGGLILFVKLSLLLEGAVVDFDS